MLNRLFNHLVTPKLALASAKSAASRQGLAAFQVVGANMAPTIEPDEIAWYEPLRRNEMPSRGQVIALSLDACGPILVPYRVIAVPGETVELRGGTLLVNEKVIDEPYLQFGRAEQEYSRSSAPTFVPEGHLWVLGDFRDMSKDSRSEGPVPLAAAVGCITHAHRRGEHSRPREVR